MSFRLNTCRQSKNIEDSAKAFVYCNEHKLAKKCRFAAIILLPVVAISSAMITIATRIALIAESIFKGVINILGCPFAKSCSLKRGIKQLCGSTIKNVCVLPFTVLAATLTLFSIPLYLVLDIRGNSHRRWAAHDEKERTLAREKEAANNYALLLEEVGETENENELLNLAHLVLESHIENYQELAYQYNLRAAQKENLIAIKYCAHALEKGYGVEQNIKGALDYYLIAYQKDPDDIETIVKCGQIYRTGCEGIPPNYTIALEYYERAADLNDIDSMVTMAEMLCLGGHAMEKNIPAGIGWLIEASNRNNRYAKRLLAGIIETFPHVTKDFPELTRRHARSLKFYAKLGIADEDYALIKEKALQFLNQIIDENPRA